MADDCYIGTSGWQYRHWRRVFYPEDLPAARWLAYYAQRLAAVEVNNTFYRLPAIEVFEAWREQAPPGFRFALKASRYITHLKKLKDVEEPLKRLLAGARHLGDRLGPILFQLPPHWGPNLERLERFLDLLPRTLAAVFEFRDPTWLVEDVFRRLHRHGAGYCIADLEGQTTPVRAVGRLAYIRLHGPGRAYEGSYDDEALRRWAGVVRHFRRQGLPVYVFFNNDVHGHAVRNALRLRELLRCESRGRKEPVA